MRSLIARSNHYVSDHLDLFLTEGNFSRCNSKADIWNNATHNRLQNSLQWSDIAVGSWQLL